MPLQNIGNHQFQLTGQVGQSGLAASEGHAREALGSSRSSDTEGRAGGGAEERSSHGWKYEGRLQLNTENGGKDGEEGEDNWESERRRRSEEERPELCQTPNCNVIAPGTRQHLFSLSSY